MTNLLVPPTRVIHVVTAVTTARRMEMTTFTIDSENNITAHGSAAEAKSIPEAEQFSSAKELGRLAANWPGSRLVEVWNSLPGQKPVKKFTNRKAAVTRIWAAIQSVGPDGGAQAARVATKKAKSGKRASRTEKPATARDGSKTSQILELLKRPGGATLQELMKVSGWQAHSVRGFVSGTLGKKMGLQVNSAKKEEGGERTYSIKA
jgi:uncharacterized protein DUF3489